MPTAWREGRLGALVEALPHLGAGELELPSHSLPRAASFLALLAHGYFYFGGKEQLPPEQVFTPGRQVARRLGRAQPCMHINDLVLFNWRVTSRACRQRAAAAAVAAYDHKRSAQPQTSTQSDQASAARDGPVAGGQKRTKTKSQVGICQNPSPRTARGALSAPGGVCGAVFCGSPPCFLVSWAPLPAKK